jgi:hypothetical protein
MTEEQTNLVLEITNTLKEGITSNHDFSKQIAQGVKGLADLVLIIEKRLQALEKLAILNDKEMENK